MKRTLPWASVRECHQSVEEAWAVENGASHWKIVRVATRTPTSGPPRDRDGVIRRYNFASRRRSC